MTNLSLLDIQGYFEEGNYFKEQYHNVKLYLSIMILPSP